VRCPKGIAPTAAIAGLKRLTARAALRGELPEANEAEDAAAHADGLTGVAP
jgi:fumarate reductase iron-sulfur subunit